MRCCCMPKQLGCLLALLIAVGTNAYADQVPNTKLTAEYGTNIEPGQLILSIGAVTAWQKKQRRIFIDTVELRLEWDHGGSVNAAGMTREQFENILSGEADLLPAQLLFTAQSVDDHDYSFWVEEFEPCSPLPGLAAGIALHCSDLGNSEVGTNAGIGLTPIFENDIAVAFKLQLDGLWADGEESWPLVNALSSSQLHPVKDEPFLDAFFDKLDEPLIITMRADFID